ncbi:GNAT family N-acetyltransferase [Devosia sediminis]|uniref:GNAT family N-acetyltransferase n=1 Tax=Devosia sediminis TaxID=2798801 RepID=A0A934IQF0_9HYPH|nr:GNAT family protein [Devosia sediminis]MBJ3784913.1 GNAT family N-acetyltransferase [Devosia sediminis]
MTITIRPITEADAEGFHAALDSVARENRYLRLTEAPPVEASREFIAANIEKGNPQWVAVDEGRIVGWCDICRSDESGSEHCGSLGMGLVASHRGRGIGHQLITETLVAAASGFERVELDVYSSNLPAIRLYEKVGFVHEGRRRRAILRGGEYQDILTMGLLFN